MKLKDKADAFVAQAFEFGGAQRRDRFAVDPDLALRRPIEAAQTIEQSRFTRSRSTDDRYKLAASDVEAGMAECKGRRFAKGFGQFACGDAIEARRISQPGASASK